MATDMINGFPCKTCTDVDYAKKHIDPAHPKDGPYGVNSPDKRAKAAQNHPIKFGGALAGLNDRKAVDAGGVATRADAYAAGSLVNLTT